MLPRQLVASLSSQIFRPNTGQCPDPPALVDPAPSRRVGPGHLQRCLPTSTILSFWASVIGHSLVMMLKMPLDILSVEKISSFVSCVARLFFLHQHACAEIFLLAVVAYDRSVAMCQPRGSTVSRQKVCAVAVAGLRAGATLPLSAPAALTFVCPAAAPMSLTASSERCWPVLLRAAGRVRSLSPQVAPIPWCATWPCWAPVG